MSDKGSCSNLDEWQDVCDYGFYYYDFFQLSCHNISVCFTKYVLQLSVDASHLRNNVKTIAHTWLLISNTSEVKLKGERASMKSNFPVTNIAMFSEKKFQLHYKVFVPLGILARGTLDHHP